MPTHQHDCDHCTSLEDCVYGNHTYDLYFCNQGGLGPTVIARYGDDDSANCSGIPTAQTYKRAGYGDHPLAIAYDRAVEKGLIA